MRESMLVLAILLSGWASPVLAQSPPVGYSAEECPPCARWNAPKPPVHLFGNTYWVGTEELGAVLITSDRGHALIDGGLPESATLILANIEALGFDPSDVRVILNSHAHYDHAGGIAALQRATGAEVLSTGASAQALLTGELTADDPQRDTALAFPAVPAVSVISDGDTVRAGSVNLIAVETPGHSPGGTSWTWRSCDAESCMNLVYADSQTPVSDEGYLYSDGDRAARFELGLDAIANLPCDILLTPHPGASDLWDRLEVTAGQSRTRGLVDSSACARYAERYRVQLRSRLSRERGGAGLWGATRHSHPHR